VPSQLGLRPNRRAAVRSDTAHDWVTFVYKTVQMSFNFSGLSVVGASNGSDQTVLDYLSFPENTSYHFDSVASIDTIHSGLEVPTT
jgi:hypothetical protein